MINRLFTFGCSYTIDNYQSTWADLLSRQFDLELFNRAERGAGANFVSKRILASTDIQADNSLVVIMWPGADRFDLWADDSTPHLLQDQHTASWLDGCNPMLVDLDGRRNHGKGYILNGSMPRGYKHYYFKYFYSKYQCIHDWYTWIIQTQLWLKSKNIRNLMMSAFALTNPVQYHHDQCQVESYIFDALDLESFVGPSLDQGFSAWCKVTQQKFFTSHYPATSAHQAWIDQFLADPVKNILVDAAT